MEAIDDIKTARSPHMELIENPALYLKSIGELDGRQLRVAPQIGITVLRLILGATENMPFRGLSYIQNAVAAAHELGVGQVQIVHANTLGNKVNGINKRKADDAAKALFETAAKAGLYEGSISVLHAIDSPLDTGRYKPLLANVFSSHIEIAEKLLQRGSTHNGDAEEYSAAHFAYQDTDLLELKAIDGSAPEQERAEHIISIGCQKELTFYLARMAMRQIAGSKHDMIEHTSQLFTRHVVPPYYFARKGEPTLEEGVDSSRYGLLEADANTRLHVVADKDARKDIKHFIEHRRIAA